MPWNFAIMLLLNIDAYCLLTISFQKLIDVSSGRVSGIFPYELYFSPKANLPVFGSSLAHAHLTMSSNAYQVTALARSASVVEAMNAHWKEYLMESAELGVFMLSTCICGTLIYSKQSPLSSLALSPAFESSLMGLAMATTAFLIIQSPFGRRSGAHLNPAVTLTFLWLGRMHRWDAVFYAAAQLSGAIAGVLAARGIVGLPLSAEPVRYMVTLPGTYGSAVAFAFEFLLSVLLMSTVLYMSNHRLFARFTPALVALLTVLSFVLSSSISGFSVNPARTFSSALFAWIWRGIWIYLSAPFLGMLTAAAIYTTWFGSDRVYCAKVFHDMRSTCPFPCHFQRVYRET
jgi:aquaporin Z